MRQNRSRNILNGNANLDLCGACSVLRVGGGGGGKKEDVASLERHLRSPIVKVRSHVRVHDSKYVDPRRSVRGDRRVSEYSAGIAEFLEPASRESFTMHERGGRSRCSLLSRSRICYSGKIYNLPGNS